MTLQLSHQILWQVSQTTTQQRFHDDSRDATLLEFVIEVAGIDIVLADLVGIIPVQVVQLYLHEVPVVFVLQGEHLIKHRLLTMERETEVTDTTSLTLLHQKVHDTVVHITAIELVHTTTDGVQQIVVDIVHLQLLHRVLVHLDGLLSFPIVAVEV